MGTEMNALPSLVWEPEMNAFPSAMEAEVNAVPRLIFDEVRLRLAGSHSAGTVQDKTRYVTSRIN